MYINIYINPTAIEGFSKILRIGQARLGIQIAFESRWINIEQVSVSRMAKRKCFKDA